MEMEYESEKFVNMLFKETQRERSCEAWRMKMFRGVIRGFMPYVALTPAARSKMCRRFSQHGSSGNDGDATLLQALPQIRMHLFVAASARTNWW